MRRKNFARRQFNFCHLIAIISDLMRGHAGRFIPTKTCEIQFTVKRDPRYVLCILR